MSAQSIEALNFGNEIRFAQVAERRRMESMKYLDSRNRAAEILRNPSAHHIQRMKLRYLLGSISRVGPSKMAMILRRSNLPGGRLERRIEELSERERLVLAWVLESMGRRK